MSFNILSIDGGGIRGIIPATILSLIERHTGKRICDLFDLIAGTSTGGILACGLLLPDQNAPDELGITNKKPKFAAQELLEIYTRRGAEIFPPSFYDWVPFRTVMAQGSTYPNEGIEKVLEEICGRETTMPMLIGECLISSYDVAKRKPKFFRRTPRLDESPFYVKDVLRATSAAPVYFNPAPISSVTGVKGVFVDGGLSANNPSLCAWADAVHRHNASPKDIRILSLGCGTHSKSYTYEGLKIFRGYQWVKPIIDFLFDGASKTVDFQLQQIMEAFHDEEIGDGFKPYLRLDYPLGHVADDPTPELDDASPKNIDALKATAQRFAEDQLTAIKTFLATLTPNPHTKS